MDPLSRIGSRLRAFQRAICELLMLPLTPQKVAQKKRICRILNKILSSVK